MAPLPEEDVRNAEDEIRVNPTPPGERVVISGISGQFPQAYHVKDLSRVLYEKENPIKPNSARWEYNNPEIVKHSGHVPDLNRFDAQFFRVHYRLGQLMDPMIRKILEQTFQAIYDAGVSPQQIWGKKVGVFVTCGTSEADKALFYNLSSSYGLGMLGCSKTMMANRISYWLNLKGPSVAMDQACTGSFGVLNEAYQAMQRGACDAAIIGAANLTLLPHSILHYQRVVKLNKDGTVRSFDENADGGLKTEAINIMFLQKAKDALRTYAELVHVKNEYVGLPSDDTNPRFGYYRDPQMTTNFLMQFYKEAGIPPHLVDYVEAFGSAQLDADKSELEAIEAVFCENRPKTKPLLVGSVVSNIGSSEAASGISGITKVLLAYQSGRIAANMHCDKPRQDVAALRENRMRIVTEHEDIHLSYAAVNGMSYTGINGHALLRDHWKPKDLNRYKSPIPHLVVLSGRQESSVKRIIEDLKSRTMDPEEIALLHNIHQDPISGHLGRGFVILDTDEEKKTVSIREQTEYFDESARPLWFVYSGMGSQWAGMGAELMRIPTFAKAIERCHKVLEPKGIDIVNIITTKDEAIFDNILNSFVGIAAIQIGLTDILKDLGFKPDKYIGHSVGEMGCAYIDGCFTTEEMMLAAYSRGTVSNEAPFIRGSMAAVGLGYDQIIEMIPSDIDVACHNGPDSCTLSGPADSMKEFVEKLKSQGIFAKEVPCANIAYHSRYVAVAGNELLKCLKEVVKTPKPRSEKWLSTSVPKNKWEEPACQISDAQYHTNNLLNPVLFEEVLRLVPYNAVLVEVAPHGLLQAILKRALPERIHIPLTRRGHSDSAVFLLEAIGKVFMNGFYPKVQTLYPRVEFPVSTGTPHLSNLVEWAHEEKWALPRYVNPRRRIATSVTFVISIHDDEHSYLRGNVIRDKTVFPFAGALIAVWDTLAMSRELPRRSVPVVFRDVQLFSQPPFHSHRQLRISVSLHRGSSWFEVLDDISVVATGYIMIYKRDEEIFSENWDEKEKTDKLQLQSSDIYNCLLEMDAVYSGEFRSIHTANSSFTEAQLLSNNNWITLLDGMIQLNALRSGDGITPYYVERLYIDSEEHSKIQPSELDGKSVIPTKVFKTPDITRCGGLVLKGVRFRTMPSIRRDLLELQVLEKPRAIKKNGYDSKATAREKIIKESNVVLSSERIGDLNSLQWKRVVKTNDVGVPVTVHYAALNQRDAKVASGAIPVKANDIRNSYGMDFSGVTASGQRVMGVVESGAACRWVYADPHLLWPVPKHWTLEDAATVPSAYMHAYYCLCLKYQLFPNSSVLVHGATGALGQAAISLALSLGCKVFATVSDRNKKLFLRKLFPQIQAEHIGYSQNNSFLDMVLNATNGQGCDIVLNCFGGALKDFALKCCKAGGITYDTTQVQCQENFTFGLANLLEYRSYVVTDFSSVFTNSRVEEQKRLHTLVSEGIARGLVRPLSRVTYAPSEATRALRLLTAARHSGRVLLKMEDFIPDPSSIICSPGHCQLIICDEDSFGIQLADRLVQRGATKLLLHLTKLTAYIQLKTRTWQKNGVKVEIAYEKLINEASIVNLIKQGTELGSMESIYLVKTNLQVEKNSDYLSNVVKSLDLMSRRLCPSLKYFAVVTSESATGLQTCVFRSESGLPATLVILPQLAKNSELRDDETVPLSTRAAIDMMERALQNPAPAQRVNVLHRTTSLIQELACVAGVTLPEKLEDDDKLKDLGFVSQNIPAVCAFLRDHYNLTIKEKDVPKLTVNKIRELEKNVVKTDVEEVNGIAGLFSYVDPDELEAANETMFLPTQAYRSEMREDEFDATQTHLYILPGLEGHHKRFRLLCERLKLPALLLQPQEEQNVGLLIDTANKYVEVLTRKAGLKDNFYILGYESGVSVALEAVAILEEQGLTGTLFVMGCAPLQWQSALAQLLPNNEVELRAALESHMMALQAEGVSPPEEQARRARTARLCGSALARIAQSLHQLPRERTLRSRIVLLHAAPHDCQVACEAQLQRLTVQPLVAYPLPTQLSHATYDLRATAIINRHLHPEHLAAFEEKNLCDTYLVNAKTFVTNVEA